MITSYFLPFQDSNTLVLLKGDLFTKIYIHDVGQPYVFLFIQRCAVAVGCYRHPPECLPDQCEFLMTFKPEGDVIEFNISVSVTNDMRWAAVGFSTDDDMVTVLSLFQIDLIFNNPVELS